MASTGWAEIVAAAVVLIDDERNSELLQISPAQFYRRMAGYVNLALPMLSKPPELLAALRQGMTAPSYEAMSWVSTDESTQGETALDTGLTGYELCSAVVRLSAGPAGGVVYAPYSVDYDAETGIVTIPQQQEAGIEYELDFYTDGSFEPALTESQMRLFAMAVAVVWDQRFERDWLNITPKVKDDTFETGNESNYMEKSSQRLQRNIAAYNDALRSYEQLCAYTSVVRRGGTALV